MAFLDFICETIIFLCMIGIFLCFFGLIFSVFFFASDSVFRKKIKHKKVKCIKCGKNCWYFFKGDK